jgi:hypothetical protein
MVNFSSYPATFADTSNGNYHHGCNSHPPLIGGSSRIRKTKTINQKKRRTLRKKVQIGCSKCKCKSTKRKNF